MKWKDYVLWALLLLLCLPGWSQDTSSDREAVVTALQTQIDELKSIEQNLLQNDAELTSLREQTEILKAEIENSKQVSTEQAERLQSLTKQLEDFKKSKEVQLKNFEGLLELSNKYKQRSETAVTLSIILGGTTAGLLIAVIIMALTNKNVDRNYQQYQY